MNARKIVMLALCCVGMLGGVLRLITGSNWWLIIGLFALMCASVGQLIWRK